MRTGGVPVDVKSISPIIFLVGYSFDKKLRDFLHKYNLKYLIREMKGNKNKYKIFFSSLAIICFISMEILVVLAEISNFIK